MNGFLNILKPSGLTSSDVVVRVRRILSKNLGQKIKVGHLGTLDPGGAGVLPVAVGTATKLFDYLIYKNKSYKAGIVFGKTTDTLDSYGKIIDSKECNISLNELNAIIPNFIGNIEQVPPKYSAININGQKAYDLARKGEQIELPKRKVIINNIITSQNGINNFNIIVDCNGGTYIRSLVRDIAFKLDTVAYMSYIVRLESGSFELKQTQTLEEFEKNPFANIIEMEDILKNYYQFYDIPSNIIDKVLNGVKLNVNDLPNDIFVAKYNDKIIGMAENNNGKLILKNRL